MESTNKRYFFAVGQRSFEDRGNHFSTVVPVADTNGNVVVDRQTEFPDRGRVWWMPCGEARVTHAPPGCLVMSGIENAMTQLSSRDWDLYQLLHPTLPGPKDLIEILSPDPRITDPNELLDDFRTRCGHEPTRHVLVRIGDHLYGPLKVELDRPENDRLIEPEIRFTRPVAPHTAYRIGAAAVEGRPGHIRHKVVVQRDASPSNDQSRHTVCYEAVTGGLYEVLREEAEEVDIVSLQDAVRQVSRNFLSRRERREFLNRLGQFANDAQSSPDVIARVGHFLDVQGEVLNELDQISDALLSDESFRPRIDQAVANEVERRVDAQAARIDARANEKVARLTEEIANLNEDMQAKRGDFEKELARERETLKHEIHVERIEAQTDIESRKKDLHRQERILEESLKEISNRLSIMHALYPEKGRPESRPPAHAFPGLGAMDRISSPSP